MGERKDRQGTTAQPTIEVIQHAVERCRNSTFFSVSSGGAGLRLSRQSYWKKFYKAGEAKVPVALSREGGRPSAGAYLAEHLLPHLQYSTGAGGFSTEES